jgi:hypothetical protein
VRCAHAAILGFLCIACRGPGGVRDGAEPQAPAELLPSLPEEEKQEARSYPPGQPHAADIVSVELSASGTSALTRDAWGELRLWPRLDGSREPVRVGTTVYTQASFVEHERGWMIATVDGEHRGRLHAFDRDALSESERSLAGEWKQVHAISEQRAIGVGRDDVLRRILPEPQTDSLQLPGPFVHGQVTAAGHFVVLTGAFAPRLTRKGRTTPDPLFSFPIGRFDGNLVRYHFDGESPVAAVPIPFETDYPLQRHLFSASPDGWTVAFSHRILPEDGEPTYAVGLISLNNGTRRQLTTGLYERDDGHPRPVGTDPPEIVFVDEKTLLVNAGDRPFKRLVDVSTGHEHPAPPSLAGVKHDRVISKTWVGAVERQLAVTVDRTDVDFIGYRPFHPWMVAVSPTSERIAWSSVYASRANPKPADYAVEVVVDDIAELGAKEPVRFVPGFRWLRALHFDADERLLMFDGGETVLLWDWREGRIVAAHDVRSSPPLSFKWLRLRSGHSDFDAETGLWGLFDDGEAMLFRVSDIANPLVDARYVSADRATSAGLLRGLDAPDGGVWAADSYGNATTARFSALQAKTENKMKDPASAAKKRLVGFAMSRNGVTFENRGDHIVRTSASGSETRQWKGRVRSDGSQMLPSPTGDGLILLPSCEDAPGLLVIDFRVEPPTHWQVDLLHVGDAVVWSPDGRYVATVRGPREPPRLLDARDGKVVYSRAHLGFSAREGLDPRRPLETVSDCEN